MTKLSKTPPKDQSILPKSVITTPKKSAVGSPAKVPVDADQLSQVADHEVHAAIKSTPTWSPAAGGAAPGSTAGVRLQGSKPLSASARPSFAKRPEVQTDNDTRERVTTSWGISFDTFAAGRLADPDLLHELAGYHRDPMNKAAQVAELASLGVIDGKAFRQITNNTNFKGWKEPLETRLAFALGIAIHGGAQTLEKFFHQVNPMKSDTVSPLETLWTTAGIKEPFESWSATLSKAAAKILQAAAGKSVMKNPSAAAMLRRQIEVATGALPVGLDKISAGGLIGYRAMIALSAAPEQALQVAQRVDKGELDPYTLRLLSPAKPGAHVIFRDNFPKTAVVGTVTSDQAIQIAADVARGDLGLDQLRGFYMRFGAIDEEYTQKLNLPNAAQIVRAVNRGEIDPDKLEKVMDPSTYFSSKLAAKVWRRMFSGEASNWGGKYTVSGSAPSDYYTAPLTERLTYTVVTQLASSPAKFEAFRAAFAEKIVEALPSKKAMDKRVDEPGEWEVDLYQGAMETAFRQVAKVANITL